MKRNTIIIVAILLLFPHTLRAEEVSRYDSYRYGRMAQQGVWTLGLGLEPVVPLTHPTSIAHGGHRLSGVGSFGVRLEGGYFVVDNMRLSAAIAYVGNGWSNALRWNIYDASTTLSQLRFSLGAHWNIGRWELGGGIDLGRSTLGYTAADIENGGVNIDHFGSSSFTDRRTFIGPYYEASYLINPFLRGGAYYAPAFCLGGGGYTHTLGLRLTIYLPFTDAVVCK